MVGRGQLASGRDGLATLLRPTMLAGSPVEGKRTEPRFGSVVVRTGTHAGASGGGTSAALLVTAGAGLGESGPWSPQAHEAGDERDEEHLAGQHLEHGQDLPDRAGWDEVAVAGRCQGRVAEEQVLAGLGVRDASEDLAALEPSEREETGSRTAGRAG